MLKFLGVAFFWSISILGLCISIHWNDIEIERLLTLILVLISGLLPSIRKYDKVVNNISLQSVLHVLSGVLSSILYGVSCGLLKNNEEVAWLFISFSSYTILIGYTHWVFTKIEGLGRIMKVSLYSLLLSVGVWITSKGVDEYNRGVIQAQDLIGALIGFWIAVYTLIMLVKIHFVSESIYGDRQILIDESEDESEDGVLLRI